MFNRFNCIWLAYRCHLDSAWKITDMTRWSEIFANRSSIVCSRREDVADEKLTKRRLSARSDERWRCASSCSRRREKMTFHLTKLSSSSFWQNENTCNVRIKREIDAKSARRWWRTLRLREWSCTKIWQNRKALSSRIWERNESSWLIISSFDAFSRCYLRVVSAIISDKRSNMCFSSVRTDSRDVNACWEKKKRRTWEDFSTRRRD
jgi:hypothetical protein